MLQSVKMTPRQVSYIYDVFQQLKQHDPLTMTTGPNEVSTESVKNLVRTKRPWVSNILMALLALAGYTSIVTWSGFIYSLISFCTLSKLELCQVMYLMIAQTSKSWTIQYVTSAQLNEFYNRYDTCPILSFNTGSIDFAKLPMAKYAIDDFVELVYRFSQLINPCMHLQRELRCALPHIRFWTNYDNIQELNRKIDVDFFRCPKVTTIADVVAAIRGVKADNDAVHAWSKDEEEAAVTEPLVQPEDKGSKQQEGSPRSRPESPQGPLWLKDFVMGNKDPLRGIALGSAAVITLIGADRPYKVPDAEIPRSVEEAKLRIRQTMVPPRSWAQAAPPSDLDLESGDVKAHQLARAQEVDFIRKSRATQDRRDDMVTIMGRSCSCELVTRPARKVQGHY